MFLRRTYTTISDQRHVFGKILLKLVEIAYNAKNGIPFFVLK
jgi:hypothetical protein